MTSLMISPPKARQKEEKLEKHGDIRIDPYYWLNDRENPEVTEYLRAENSYTEFALEPVHELREKLFDELKSRIKEDDSSVPYRKDSFYYYFRYESGSEYPLFCRKKDKLDQPETILLDVNELATGKTFIDFGSVEVSPDHNLLAYTVDYEGRRKYELFIKDLQKGTIIASGIRNCGGDISWANDNRNMFITVIDEKKLRYDRVLRFDYLSGEPASEVYYEKDETFYYISTEKTTDERYILITCNSTLQSETLYIDAGKPYEPFRIFQERKKELLYDIEHYKDKFYIVTNHNAQNFRLMECPENSTGIEMWKELIAHRPDVLLEDILVYDEYMVLSERYKGLAQIRIINQNDNTEHYLDFGEESYTAELVANVEMNNVMLRFNYSSLTTPNTTFDYNMEDRVKTLMKQQEIPGGTFAQENYITRRLHAMSTDGTMVPISVVYRRDVVLDGSNPLLLYAYGSYGISTDPYFSSNRLSLLDRGFVFAIAHVRGGQELGRWWYEEGKLLKKKNTFTDFIDCALFLIKEKYTCQERLFAMGGSAGGLLIGAVVNIRPDLWKGVVAAVPFVDALTTMCDSDIPLTTAEFDEWGDPNNPEHYRYIKSYSPYDNIKQVNYPNILATAGLNDSQVQYWEPAKWIARLRDNNTGESKLLLYTIMDAGHGGASGRYESLKEVALEYAFFLFLT